MAPQCMYSFDVVCIPVIGGSCHLRALQLDNSMWQTMVHNNMHDSHIDRESGFYEFKKKTFKIREILLNFK